MSKNQSIFLEIGRGLYIKTGLPTIASWKTPDRPKRATQGLFGFNTQTNKLEYFDGEAWFEASLNKA